MSYPIEVFIEIEKGSNHKYEYNSSTHTLELDRVLTPPHVYPFAYGFIPGTRADDGDELDVLILTDSVNLSRNTHQRVYIVGALLMEDEKGNDEKILAVLESDYETGKIANIDDLPSETLVSIQTFFANYKLDEPGKWSRVHGFVNQTYAYNIYTKTILKPAQTPRPLSLLLP